METITSRKNAMIVTLRTLAKDAAFRRERQEYLCDGSKFLLEALQSGCEVTAILWKDRDTPQSAMVLENVQDPGNVGTVLRTANALGIDCVVLTGACADVFSPKTVRATMGAIFRQRVEVLSFPGLREALSAWGLPLYGAVLSERAKGVLQLDLRHCAIAVGSEGRGLTEELIALCDEELMIPMRPESESLNASVAAASLMWEMKRGTL